MSGLEASAIVIRRGGRPILNRVDIHLRAGQLCAIVGPNGSGKSTLLKALAGIWQPTEGSILLDNQPLQKLPRRDIARRIAFVAQDTRIDFAFTVEEIVGMGRHPHRGRFDREKTDDRRAIETAIERCDITHLVSRTVDTLSGGERQRVLIARSLAVEPQFILLDEPTASLDIEHTLEILELCSSLARDGQCVTLATHDLNAVARYATHVALIEHGRLSHMGDRDGMLHPHRLEQVFRVQTELLATSSGQTVYVFHRKRDKK